MALKSLLINMNKIIELKNIEKYYKERKILNNLNLEVLTNDIVVIKGISGSGKSTLLNILGFLDCNYSDEYKFFTDIVDKKSYSLYRNKYIGFVFQNYNHINGLNVIDNITIPYLYSDSLKIDNDYIFELLNFLDINNIKKQKVCDLSGGEKQRVAIARALSMKPKLILADEPTGNLDKVNKNRIVDILKDINKK